MTTTRNKKTELMKGTLAILAAMLLGQTAAAETSLTASRYRTVAKCEGTFDVKVIDWSGYGPALYIYEDGHLLTAQWVEESVSDDGRVEMTSYKTDASVFDGGASLRIRSRDSRIPQTEGTAFLTYDGGNARLECSVY